MKAIRSGKFSPNWIGKFLPSTLSTLLLSVGIFATLASTPVAFEEPSEKTPVPMPCLDSLEHVVSYGTDCIGRGLGCLDHPCPPGSEPQ